MRRATWWATGLLVVLLTCPEACLCRPDEQDHARSRADLVSNHIANRGIDDPRVLAAMRRVPRHEFVPASKQRLAYADRALPIGHGQTISQPYIVALMTQLARLDESSRVLEIGTGSGYQAAVLAEVAGQVYTIEIIEPLAARSRALLTGLGYTNIRFRVGDGYQGWPEAAPFDAILVTAAPPLIPEPLKQQLRVGGRLVVPVGTDAQHLRVITRTESSYTNDAIIPVRFVPMTGTAQN